MTELLISEGNLSKSAKKLITLFGSNVVCLRGDLGSGKTTLVKNILKVIGAIEEGSSPTFNIVNHYHDINGQLLAYHIDCYRINSFEEALDFGIEDYLNAECYLFIEWPERIDSILPRNRTEIFISPVNSSTRKLKLVNQS